MAGKLITILQLILSAGLLILVWNSGMVPGLYLALLGGGLLRFICSHLLPAVCEKQGQICRYGLSVS